MCIRDRLTPDDMLATGLATHKVASLEGVLDGIVEHGPGYLDEIGLEQGESQLEALYEDIEATFTGSWAEIRERLDGEFGEKVQELTKQASPSSLVAAAELIAANASQDLAGALDNERRLGCLLYTSPSPRDRTRSRMPSSA